MARERPFEISCVADACHRQRPPRLAASSAFRMSMMT
jgi:hypothetical protein